jgi:mannose-6-phosphate isomerase-like protein (cupin superfamily)
MLDTTISNPTILAPDHGEVIEARGCRVVIKVASERQSLCDYTAPPGFPGPPLHVHAGFDETFLVLEGHLTIRIRDEASRLEPGAVAFAAGAVPHTFANPELEPVRFLVVYSPGGFEEYFRAVAAGDDEAMQEVARRVGYAPITRAEATRTANR